MIFAIFLKVLILGGTTFLGPHLVDELKQRGHEVTLFNRGTHSFPHTRPVEQLRGDRDGNLDALKGRRWDAVIDTSGYLPRVVDSSSQLLTNVTNHYTFISSISAYKNFNTDGIDENYPLAELETPTEEITWDTYGALKADCEKVIQRYFLGKALIIRPGLIVGPYDSTDRFTYWPCRIKAGGNVLAPNNPADQIQVIDVRDLAKWIVEMVENQAVGVYNATGKTMTFETLLSECQKVTGTDVALNWISEKFLIKHQTQDWTELPLWLSSERNMPGLLHISSNKAYSKGLTLRPLSETIRAVLEWTEKEQHSLPPTMLSREKEQELLQLWRQEKNTK